MVYLRRLFKGDFEQQDKGWSFKYTNADILRITKTIDLLTFIKSQQLKYVINILKRSDQSITKKLLFNDDKTTKRGRPHMTLMTSVLAEYGSLEEMIESQM